MTDEEMRAAFAAMDKRFDMAAYSVIDLRTVIMARIDRLQDALTLEREEKIVDQSMVLLLRRQLQHLQDRVQALEEQRRP
jgi:hypothetical protein